MSARRVLVLAALPGLALAVAACAGWVPGIRDLPGYFVPLRQRTAEVLEGQRGPFWNPDEGCGEPYYANPQTGLLYPLAWLTLVLPAARAVGAEAGLHLALLAVGCALLARRLGASPAFAVAAGWGVVCAGPVVDSVGVLNNLETLAWLPWLWIAALAGSGTAMAACLALAYLAAEPQLAAAGAVIALLLAPGKKTFLAATLACGIVAAQLVPFAFWVGGGDRGLATEAADATAGSIRPAELPSLLVPGRELAPRPDRFVADLTVPLWGVVLGLGALFGESRVVRRLALAAIVLIAASVAAGVGWGSELWLVATGGLLSYPGRLLFVATIALLPAGAAASRRWLSRRAAVATAIPIVVAAWVLGGSGWPGGIQGLTAGVALLGGATGGIGAVAGSAALAASHLGALRLRRDEREAQPACLDAQLGTGRVYVVQPSWQQISLVGQGTTARPRDYAWGYTSLEDGRRMVRTFAPLRSRALAAHLRQADRGPVGRWWLDALAATRIVSHRPIPGFPVLCSENGVVVMANPGAWPEVQITSRMPSVGEIPRVSGAVVQAHVEDDRRTFDVRVPGGGGVLLLSGTPDPGWRFHVDGEMVKPVQGPGVLQGVPLPPGRHWVTARYRPPGLLLGCAISALGVGLLLGGAWRRW